MIIVDNVVMTDDIKEQLFVCDIDKCKGACCVEGDLGAPLNADELPVMQQISDAVKPYMSPKGVAALNEKGCYVKEENGDVSTPIIAGKECMYAVYDENNHLKCAIEMAYLDKAIDFCKPISCHLYPLRVTPYDQYDAINYHQWDICADACVLGASIGMPLYQFLKTPLVRKYGVDWYDKLLLAVERG